MRLVKRMFCDIMLIIELPFRALLFLFPQALIGMILTPIYIVGLPFIILFKLYTELPSIIWCLFALGITTLIYNVTPFGGLLDKVASSSSFLQKVGAVGESVYNHTFGIVTDHIFDLGQEDIIITLIKLTSMLFFCLLAAIFTGIANNAILFLAYTIAIIVTIITILVDDVDRWVVWEGIKSSIQAFLFTVYKTIRDLIFTVLFMLPVLNVIIYRLQQAFYRKFPPAEEMITPFFG